MKAVIPAAGFGTRFLPATKSQPKEMLPVYNKPAIQYVIEEAVASGIDDILIVTGRHKRSIEDHFDKYYELEFMLQKAGKDLILKDIRKITDLADICYVRQKNQEGVGDAIKCAEKHIEDESFVVLLGDTITKDSTPCTKQLIDVYNKYKKPTVSIHEIPKGTSNMYGLVEGENVSRDIYKLNDFFEKPEINQTSSNLAIVGRYVLTSDIFDKIDQTQPGFNDEILLTGALSKIDEVYGVKFNGKVFNIENRLEWLKSSIYFAMDDTEFRDDLIKHMKTFI